MQFMISICLLALTLSMNLKTLECVQMVTAIQGGKKKRNLNIAWNPLLTVSCFVYSKHLVSCVPKMANSAIVTSSASCLSFFTSS